MGAFGELGQRLNPQAAGLRLAEGREVVWRRGHPRWRRSGWWVRELPPVLQPFACGSRGKSMEKVGTRGGPRCCPHRAAGTHRAARLLPAVLPDLGAASRFPRGRLERSFAAARLRRAGGEALLALPAPLQPSLCPSQAEAGRELPGSAGRDEVRRLGCTRGSREGDRCSCWRSAVPT